MSRLTANLFINDKLYAIINVTQANAILAAKGLLWLGMIEVAASKDYKPGIWKTDVTVSTL